MNEDILKKALEQTLDESYNELIDQDIPDYDFSPEFKAKMDGLILSQQTQPEKKRSRMLWFTAMAAAAALLAVTVGVNQSARPSRTHDTPSVIISETAETTSKAETSTNGTTGTTSSNAAVTETVSSATDTTTAKKVSDSTENTTIKTSVKTTETTIAAAKQNSTSVKSTSAQTAAKATETTSAEKVRSSETSTNSTTAVSVPVTTASVTVSVTETVTTTDVSPEMPEERSFSMKKISAFLAAILAAPPAIPPDVIASVNAAEPQKDIVCSPLIATHPYNFIDEDVYERFAVFNKDETVLDFNGDGKFDINDVYIYHLMVNNPEHIQEDKLVYFDVDGDGENNTLNDGNSIIYYFATYHTVTLDMLSPESYYNVDDDFLYASYNNENWRENHTSMFTYRLMYLSNSVYQLYDAFKELVESKNLSLDVDGNGVEDFGDILDINCFIYGNNYSSYIVDYPHFMYNYRMSEDVYERCTELNKQCLCPNNVANYLSDYAMLYFFEKYGFNPDYTSPDYISYLRQYKTDPPASMTDYQYSLGYGYNDMRYYYRPGYDDENNDYFGWGNNSRYVENEYFAMCERVESGETIIPDLNSDGLIDAGDARLAELFFDDYRYQDDIPFPLEYRENFLKNMDLNNNGMSGDINDITIYQIYIANLNNYKSENCIEEITQYYFDHPDFDPEHAGEYTSLNHVYSIPDYQAYLDNIEAGKAKEPDIDKNGKIDIADYVYASLIQRDKIDNYGFRMAIVPEEVKEYYLNECDFDNDGHCATENDLFLLNRYVREKIGVDADDYPGESETDYYIMQEEFVSQFDDKLKDYEKTARGQLKPELTEGMTYKQILSITNYNNESYNKIIYNQEEIENNITDEQKKIIDTNHNGIVDLQDYAIAEALHDNYYIDKSRLDEDERNLVADYQFDFYNNFDLDGNGVSGDTSDLRYAEIIFCKLLDTETPLLDYLRSLLDKYNKEVNEELNAAYEKRVEFEEQYRKDIASGKKPAPDINEDGKVDIADYVAADIASRLNDTDSFRSELITDAHIISDEQLERFYKEFDLNNNGISGDAEDTRIIGLYLRKELSYSDFEFDADMQEYVSHYDSYLLNSEKSRFCGMKPSLVKDMTPVEKLSIITYDYDLDEDYFINLAKAREFDKDMIVQFDVDADGILTPEDYIIAMYLNRNYYSDRFDYSEDAALITKKIKDNFYSSFDPDGDGVCGNYSDIMLMEKYLTNLFWDDFFVEEYRDGRFYNAFKFTLDYIFSEYGLIDEEVEERNGDANVDGEVTLADSVAILQALANPDKFTLSNEGLYNADINNTGDGVTLLDAQKIQKNLLGIE